MQSGPYVFRRLTDTEKEQLWDDGNFVGGAAMLMLILLSLLFTVTVTVLYRTGVFSAADLAKDDLSMGNTAYLLFYGAVYTVSMGAPSLLALCLFRRKPQICAARIPAGTAIAGVFIGLGGCMLANIVAGYVTVFLEQYGIFLPEGQDMLQNTPQSLLLNIVVTALLPALLEEFLFRVCILQTLRRYGDAFAVVVTALLFGVMHAYVAQSVFAVLVGLLLGWLVVATDNVYLAVTVHFLNNTVSLLLDYVRLQCDEIIGNILSAAVIYGLLLLGIVVLAIAAKRKTRLLHLPRRDTPPAGACAAALWKTPLMILMTVLFVLRMLLMNL